MVGKLVINFGVLEFETYLWLVQLSESPERIPEFTKLRFGQRVKKITDYIESRSYSDTWKEESQKCWIEASERAKFRNKIVHNPLTFGWSGEREEGEPDFIGIPDLQRPGSSPNPLVSKTEMNEVINSIVSLVTKLKDLRIEWCSIRDAMDESGQ